MRNSRKDPRMVRAEEELRSLLREVALAGQGALQEYDVSPRWCGIPGPDFNGSLSYPYDWILMRNEDDRLTMSLPEISIESEAFDYHRQCILRLISKFERGLPPTIYDLRVNESTDPESPLRYIDRVRAILRWEFRLDSSSMVTRTFALETCVKKGRPYRRASSDPMCGHQDYEYAVLPLPDIEMRPASVRVAEAMRDAFRCTERALLPDRINARQREFLSWMRGRGGRCRLHELIKWIQEDPSRGSASKGQGTERWLLRDFCEKDSPQNSRADWTLREGVLDLLNQ